MIIALHDTVSASRGNVASARVAAAKSSTDAATPSPAAAPAAASAPSDSAQTPAVATGKSGSRQSGAARSGDGDRGTQTFRDALRVRVAADDGAAPTSDTAPASADDGAPVQVHTDALWQRLFAGPAAAATLKAVKVDSQSDEAETDTAAVRSAVPAGITALIAIAAPAQPAVPPSAAAVVDTEADAQDPAAAARVASAVRRAASAALGAALPATADDVGAGPAAATVTSSTESRTAGTTSRAVDSNSSSLASQAQSVLPVWTAATDAPAGAPGVADLSPAVADGARAASGGGSLMQALGEHLQVQLARGSESAVIRLDPPSMGSIEIVIRHEAGSLQVHLNASNGEVLSQLQGIGEALRQDLMQRHQGSVSVQVSDEANDAKGRQAQTGGGREEPEQAPQVASDGEESTKFALA